MIIQTMYCYLVGVKITFAKYYHLGHESFALETYLGYRDSYYSLS